MKYLYNIYNYADLYRRQLGLFNSSTDLQDGINFGTQVD